MEIDTDIFYFFNNLAGQSTIFDIIVIFLAEYLGYLLVIVFLTLLYFSKYTNLEKLKIFLVSLISVVIARAGVTEIIRFFYNRPRPFMVLSAENLFTETSWSFPSGHATFFFALATTIYLYNKKWGIGFFAVAILINISRIIAGVHYPTDILGGAIIGIIVGYVTFYLGGKMQTSVKLRSQKMR